MTARSNGRFPSSICIVALSAGNRQIPAVGMGDETGARKGGRRRNPSASKQYGTHFREQCDRYVFSVNTSGKDDGDGDLNGYL